jgi:hypothetical protein
LLELQDFRLIMTLDLMTLDTTQATQLIKA